jgi:hypothetical protein
MTKRLIVAVSLFVAFFPGLADARFIFRIKNTTDRLLDYSVIWLDNPVHRHQMILKGGLEPGLEDRFILKHGKGIYRIQWCEVGLQEPACERSDFFTLRSTSEVFITYEDIVVRNGGGKI